MNALNQLRLISLEKKKEALVVETEGSTVDSEESKSRFVGVENKAKKFGERPDVNYKTILRCFKKHFVNDFNEVTEFKKMKRRVKSQTLESVVKTYVAKKFGSVHLPLLESYVLALILQKHPA